MPDTKRQCSKCQFFQNAQLSGNGWCTHPKRQLASDVKILVRERELACRNSWGDDLWVDANAPKVGIVSPDAVAPPRKSLFFSSIQSDDEVTSVVDTAARQEPGPRPHVSVSGGPDDIVTVTSVRRDDLPAARPAADDLNAPAIADQAERARLMARGSKDAIQKARERHSRRRKPERTLVAPDSPDAPSDHIIAAQDRDQYTPSRAGDRTPEEAYRSTPPVPREEVMAHGNGLSPASGSDARFDSVAEVRPEVDLTQLREFLAHSGPSRRNAAGSDATATTSFDLVLKRAREIKAAGVAERGVQSSAPTPVASREPAQNPGPQATPHQATTRPQARTPASTGVVWDLAGEQLSVAFERARVAIDAPTAPRVHRVDGPSRIDRKLVTETIEGAIERPFGGSNDRADDSPDFPVDVTPAAEPNDDLGGDELLADTSYREDDAWSEPDPDEFLDVPPTPRESPRGSWWRSLNFGRKRRYQPQPVQGDWYGGERHEPGRRSTALLDDGPHPDGDMLDDRYGLASSAVADEASEPEIIFATSDESWLQDAWEFPDPQPPEWHEARADLLGQPAGSLSGEWVPTGVCIDSHPGDDLAMPDDDLFPSRETLMNRPAPARAESPSFALDEPAGMDAFRTALFGADPPPLPNVGSVSPGLHENGSDTPRQPIPGAAPRAETRFSPQDESPVRTRKPPAWSPGEPAPSRTPRGSRFSPAHYAFDTEFDIRDAIDDQDAMDNLNFEVASRVPKACSTCRSFRPSETGDRGWCMNDWSATHRQMVNADDLACRSSIGDWWLAADTSWIPPSDAIQPGTPRTDRLVARSDERTSVPARSGRHVRTSKVG